VIHESVKLKDLCSFLNGGTPSRSVARYFEGEIPWITSADLPEDQDIITKARFYITEEAIESSATRIVPKDNILLVSRTGVGKVAITGTDMCISQDFTAIIPDKSNLDLRYLFRFLQSNKSYFTYYQRGATIQGITRQVIADLEIPLPPLAEQQRIAAILDKADALRAKRRTAVGKLDTLLQSTFLHMFGDPVTNPMGWETLTMVNVIIDGPQNGLYRPSSDYGSGTPIIRIDSFYAGKVTGLNRLKRVRLEPEIESRYTVRENEILINRVNSREYLGKSAIVPTLHEPTVFESNMMRLAINTSLILPQFLVSQMQHGYFKMQILSRCKDAVNQSSINQEDVKSFELRVPPLKLQEEFVCFLKKVENVRRELTQSMNQFNDLFHSLQQRAFKGEL
jgi:type I restriction enzyme, S subunit